MAVTNRKQALVEELIEKLEDKKKRAFGMYCGMIKKFGEYKVRRILSEVLHDYRKGKKISKVKLFMWRIKNDS